MLHKFIELFKCCTTSGEKIQRKEVSWCGWGPGQFFRKSSGDSQLDPALGVVLINTLVFFTLSET